MPPPVIVIPERVTAAPKLVPSMVNWTVPEGVPAPGAVALTVAVKVTGWPNTAGLADELSVVVLAAGLTVAVTTVVLLLSLNVTADQESGSVDPLAGVKELDKPVSYTETKIPLGKKIRFFGDGYQKSKQVAGRQRAARLAPRARYTASA